MDNITLSYAHPGEIDADTPAEVREKVCDQLRDLAPRLRDLIDASGRQIRNAVLTDFIEETGSIGKTAARLTEWEEGDDRAKIDRLMRLASALETAAFEVAELDTTSP